MVLGFLLYETVDFVWHFGKMSYNGSKYVYDWYYEVPTPDDIEISKLKELEDKIIHIEDLLMKKKELKDK
jgi:hypothetical protein